jgi:uncharacterized membrane protein
MNSTDQQRQEQCFENFLGNLLRAGVILAAAVVLVGGVLYLVKHGHERPDRTDFHGEPSDLRNPIEIVERAARFSGSGLIQLGLLLLIATPVARVIASVFGFLRERDYTYVVLTLIVLAILLYSLFARALV